MKAIINGELFIGNKFYTGKALILDGERIVDIVAEDELKTTYKDIETIDAEKGYVTPGFIDLQLN
ncbi:MAG: N-acetylglucosamine-6-phosphate deacetylase, partial [Cetobacterium sp.]